MAKQASGGYALREIRPDDSVSGLSLGDAEFVPLKTFLGKFAKHYHKTNAAKTYIIAADSFPQKVVGYITLLCSHITAETAPADVGEYNFDDFPAVKIARLAVDRRHRRNDLGTRLVELAIAITTENVMPNVGCRFLVLDAKKDSVPFYKKLGFLLLDTEENRKMDHPVMFMDIGRLREE